MRALVSEEDEMFKQLEDRLKALKKDTFLRLTPWQRVQVSRHPDRPYTLDYIQTICDEFIELHGDRNVAVFETSTGELPGSNRLEIAGDLGRLILEGDELKLDLYPSSNREFSETVQEMFPWRKPESSVETFSGRGGQHTEIIRNFVAAINGQETLLAPAADGIHSVEMANAMIWSGLTRKAIDLPMDAAGYAEVLAGLKAK
jgi:hypothetical protein